MFEKYRSLQLAASFSRVGSVGRKLLIVFAIAFSSIGVYSVITGGSTAVVPVVNAQTDMYLSRRIDQLEQRMIYIESRISQVESQSRTSPIMPRPLPSSSSEQEVPFLRTQIDGLRTRLGELECGLLHVDERTLTAAQRAARRRSAQGSSEKYRENSGSPIELSSRP